MSEENQNEDQDQDQGIDIEIESSGEPTQGREAPVQVSESDEELGDYGNKVQARIKKLTERYRTEERHKEEAARLAQTLLEENKQLKSRMTNLDKGYLNEYGNRLNAQTEAVKRAYREAHETGDVDAMMTAQEQLSKISIEQERYRLAKQRSDDRVEVASRPQAQAQAQTQQVQPQQAPAPKPDPKAESWAKNNEWFGSDESMTYVAFGLHRRLVEEEGFDPASDEYYSEINRRIRTEFPHKFVTKKSGGAQVASAGASASRSTAKQGRRSVRLTPSQVAMANKLRVPLEEYAKYVKD
jgi:hypothetical protein